MLGLTDFYEDRRLAGEDGWTAFRGVRFGRAGMLAPTPDALAADLVAFANGYGGWVFFGAAGGGSFAGLPADRLAETRRRVVEVAATRCHPPIHPEFHRVPLPERRGGERRLLLARIPRSLFLHRIRAGGWYCRFGSVTRRFTRRELRRARLERTLDREFDGRAVGWATRDALDDELLRPEIARGPGVPAGEVLRCSGITRHDRDDPEVARPTVAGLVALGRNPAEFLPSARIEASVFAGTAGAPAELIRSETLVGPLAAQVDAAVAFVSRFAAPAGAASDREGAAPEGGAGGRENAAAPAYSPEVVFEAVANAVAHRDYSLADDPIRLSLFADRLEVVTPGGLPGVLTPEDLPRGPHTRNGYLANFLWRQRSRVLDRPLLRSRGEGVPRLLASGGATHALRDSGLVLTLRPGAGASPGPVGRFGRAVPLYNRRGSRP